MVKYTLTEYCSIYNRPELLEEWDYEKNGEITPDNSYPNSKKRVFWRCKKGHQWVTAISWRTIDNTGCPYCAGEMVQSGENDLETLYPEIAAQWHPTKNGILKPSDVRPGTHKKVWWQCEKGHEWQAIVKSRTYGTGCPYCAGRLVVPGETDLETLYPEIAAQWHPTKNGLQKPSDFTPGTGKKVWWQCEKGHEWQAGIVTRVKGSGCPVCSGKKVVEGVNDLATLYPELAKEWHPTKNGSLKPNMVTVASNRVVWWQCERGHEWRSEIKSHTDGNGCPYCSNRKLLSGFNDLKTLFPAIAKEWDSEKNGITPDKVKPSHKKAWWRCPKGHEYYSQISSRVYQNCGCPVCAGKKIISGINDFETLFPEIASQWHPTKNGDLKPNMVSPGNRKNVWWQDELGHEWIAQISTRSYKDTGCPYCSGRKILVGFNDLASQEPKIAAQWHPTLNGTKTSEMFTCGSNRKIWWQCELGHIWQAPIGRRCYQRSGCPVCSGTVSPKTLMKYKRMMKKAMAENEET